MWFYCCSTHVILLLLNIIYSRLLGICSFLYFSASINFLNFLASIQSLCYSAPKGFVIYSAHIEINLLGTYCDFLATILWLSMCRSSGSASTKYLAYMVRMVKCVDTHLSILLIDQQSPPLTWVSKTLNWTFMSQSWCIHSSLYIQNFKNIVSNKIPYDSPWVDYALSCHEF